MVACLCPPPLWYFVIIRQIPIKEIQNIQIHSQGNLLLRTQVNGRMFVLSFALSRSLMESLSSFMRWDSHPCNIFFFFKYPTNVDCREIFNQYWLQCGASILNTGVVLTAAHCVKGLGVDIFTNYISLHDSLVCTQFGHIILGYIMHKINMFTSWSMIIHLIVHT